MLETVEETEQTKRISDDTICKKDLEKGERKNRKVKEEKHLEKGDRRNYLIEIKWLHNHFEKNTIRENNLDRENLL